MISRGLFAQSREGFLIAEADDPIAIGRWTHAWSDLLSFRITPIDDDEGFKAVLGG